MAAGVSTVRARFPKGKTNRSRFPVAVMARRLSAVMFTYIAGYTALTKADEAAALRLQEEQEKLARPLPDAHRGRKIKSMGGGLLPEFDSWGRPSTDL